MYMHGMLESTLDGHMISFSSYLQPSRSTMTTASEKSSQFHLPAITILDPQEAIDYMDSRIRRQWNALIDADGTQQKAIFCGMSLELVSVTHSINVHFTSCIYSILL